METQTGTLIQFMDAVSEEVTAYIPHRHHFEQERKAFADLLQNCRPEQRKILRKMVALAIIDYFKVSIGYQYNTPFLLVYINGFA